MIRHHVQKSAADAKRYYAQADYYADGSVLRPEFGGKAAGLLGIDGPASMEQFDRLCDNCHPLTGRQLTPRTRDDRIVGIDLTFDGPKGAGVLEALAPPEERRRLTEARLKAEQETLAEIEADAATRVRVGGRDENRTTGNMVWFRVGHDTARPVNGVPDPQPHEHYFCLNATWDAREGRWKALNLVDVIRDLPYHQAAFQARHAANLQALGYEVQRAGQCFEVVGVPATVSAKFSRRTQLIEATAAARGITDPEEKARLGAATREHKGNAMSPDQLRRRWLDRMTPDEREAVVGVVVAAKWREATGGVPRRRITPKDALRHAASHLFERQSSAPARAVLAEALTYGVGAVGPAEAWAALEQDGRFTAVVDGRLMAASREALAEERALVRLASDGRNTVAPLAPDHTIEDTRLNIAQRAAVHRLLGSRDFVTMVLGAAGVGKTTLLSEAKRAAERAGVRVVAVAPSAAASRLNLRAEGFPDAETVQALLVNPALQERARGQVVLVDEAAMLGTGQTADLLALAERLGARVWLVGDDRQNRSPLRGSPFRLLRTRAGLVPAEVLSVQRQLDGGYRKLAERARDDPAGAFAGLRSLGWVREVPDADRYRLLATDYLDVTRPERRKVGERWAEVEPSCLVVCPTHAEGAKVTAAIRDALRAEGRLGEEREFLQLTPLQWTEAQRADPHAYAGGEVLQFSAPAPGVRRGGRVRVSADGPPPVEYADRFQAYRAGAMRVAVGDRLRVTAGGTLPGGVRLTTGERLGVAGFTPAGDLVDDRGRVIPKDFGHLSGGYVVTSHGGQSRTVDRALLAMGAESRGALARTQFYTDLTRARQWCRVYTDDADALEAAVARPRAVVSASDLASRRKAQRRLTGHVLALARQAAAATRVVDTREHAGVEREARHVR